MTTFEKQTFRTRRDSRHEHGDQDQEQGDQHAGSFSPLKRKDEADPRDDDKHGGREEELVDERHLVALQVDLEAGDGKVPGPRCGENLILLLDHI